MANKQKTIFDDWKLRLTAPPLEKGAKPPMLAVSLFNNNPQIVVYPQHDNGSGVSFIPASMDVTTFATIIMYVELLSSDQSPPQQQFWDNKKLIPREQRSDPKVSMKVISRTYVGKDEKGIWITVRHMENQEAPRVKFYFGDNYYHPSKSDERTPLQRSQTAALGWSRLNMLLMANLLSDNNTGEKPASVGGQQGGGNNYRKGNNNGGGNNSYGNKSYGNNGGNKGYGKGGGGEDYDTENSAYGDDGAFLD